MVRLRVSKSVSSTGSSRHNNNINKVVFNEPTRDSPDKQWKELTEMEARLRQQMNARLDRAQALYVPPSDTFET